MDTDAHDRRERRRPDEQLTGSGAVDRRTVLAAAATGALSLTVPSSATADVESIGAAGPVTDVCSFVASNTPSGYKVPTVVEFDTAAARQEFADQYVEPGGPESVPKAVVRESPTDAGHGHLTADEIDSVAGIDGVSKIDFSPGANPFWTLDGAYDDRVFPPAESARGHVWYDELTAALEYFEAEYPELLDVETVGTSPGWTDDYAGENRPEDVYVARVTEAEGKPDAVPSIVYSLSIHGDERAGLEAGCRLLEDVLAGSAPELEPLLTEYQLVFLFSNPDGWVGRSPRTALPSVDHDRGFMRGNAAGVDTNRQYPTVGWVNPDFYPAEPTDAPDSFQESVPDALAIVDHLREYDVETLIDYHGMYVEDYMVLDLSSTATGGHRGDHVTDAGMIGFRDRLTDTFGSTEAIGDDIRSGIETEFPFYDPDNQFPDGGRNDGLYNRGTSVDTIGYEVTGGLMDWAGAPESFGGLGANALVPEIILSNNVPRNIQTYKPYWNRHLVTAYQASMRAYARASTADMDASVATGGQSIGYLRTDEVVRRSDDLPFTGSTESTGGSDTTVKSVTASTGDGVGTEASATVSVPEAARSLSIRCSGVEGASEGSVGLVDPDGETVYSVSLEDAPPTGPDGCLRGFAEHLQRNPVAGEWTIALNADAPVEATATVLAAEEYPDPRDAWDGDGFQQREYESDPLAAVEELAEHVEDTATIEPVDSSALGEGGLDGHDAFVITHDVDLGDDALAALSSFVEAGGDLVLTDRAVSFLADLDAGSAAQMTSDDVYQRTATAVTLSSPDFDHDLLQDVDPDRRELWTAPPLGYTSGEDSPATVVDAPTFQDAGGSVAATLSGRVLIGRLPAGDGSITVLGSILPPAQQTVLHPFGLADHALTFTGRTVLCNALRLEQRRYEDGELVATFGSVPLSLPSYAGDDGVVRTDGLHQAVGDWRAGRIDASLLRDVLDAWGSGTPVN